MATLTFLSYCSFTSYVSLKTNGRAATHKTKNKLWTRDKRTIHPMHWYYHLTQTVSQFFLNSCIRSCLSKLSYANDIWSSGGQKSCFILKKPVGSTWFGIFNFLNYHQLSRVSWRSLSPSGYQLGIFCTESIIKGEIAQVLLQKPYQNEPNRR